MKWEFIFAVPVLFGGLTQLQGATDGSSPRPVTLAVIADDGKGHPVKDLRLSDFQLVDNGSDQTIAAFVPREKAVTKQFVLFDLMNLSFQQREYLAQRLKTALARMALADLPELYLLQPNGTLYRIGGRAPQAVSGEVRAQELTAALTETNQLRTGGVAVDFAIRSKATYDALVQMEKIMRAAAGPKQLVWLTHGIPSSVHFEGWGWQDLKGDLRGLAARFNHDDINIYTMNPDLTADELRRDGLDILCGATGGRSYGTSDVKQVLTQARNDANATYLLAYAPSPLSTGRGIYHDVKLKCLRKGVRILSQQVYIADASH